MHMVTCPQLLWLWDQQCTGLPILGIHRHPNMLLNASWEWNLHNNIVQPAPRCSQLPRIFPLYYKCRPVKTAQCCLACLDAICCQINVWSNGTVGSPATYINSASSDEAERRLKTYIRSCMTQELLNHCAVFDIHQHKLDALYIDEKAREFVVTRDTWRALWNSQTEQMFQTDISSGVASHSGLGCKGRGSGGLRRPGW
jgi:hypothetical protein